MFFLGGGTQFVLFCSIDSCSREKRNIRLFLFFCLILISISCLLSSWPVCAASCVLLWFVCSRPRGVGFYGSSGVIVFGVCLTGPFSCRLLRTVHLILWEEQQQVFASFPRVRSAVHRAADSSCPQGSRLQLPTGQLVLGRHRLVSILVETSGCCRGSRLICQQVGLSPPGGTPGGARRARRVGWHS